MISGFYVDSFGFLYFRFITFYRLDSGRNEMLVLVNPVLRAASDISLSFLSFQLSQSQILNSSSAYLPSLLPQLIFQILTSTLDSWSGLNFLLPIRSLYYLPWVKISRKIAITTKKLAIMREIIIDGRKIRKHRAKLQRMFFSSQIFGQGLTALRWYWAMRITKSIRMLVENMQIGLMFAAASREAFIHILNLSTLFRSLYTRQTEIPKVIQNNPIPNIQNPEFKLTVCIGLSNAPCKETQPAHVAPKIKILYMTLPIGNPLARYSTSLPKYRSHMIKPMTTMMISASRQVLPMLMFVQNRAKDYTTVSEWSDRVDPNSQFAQGKSGIMNPEQQYTNSRKVGQIIKAGAFNAKTWGISSPISGESGTDQAALRTYLTINNRVTAYPKMEQYSKESLALAQLITNSGELISQFMTRSLGRQKSGKIQLIVAWSIFKFTLYLAATDPLSSILLANSKLFWPSSSGLLVQKMRVQELVPHYALRMSSWVCLYLLSQRISLVVFVQFMLLLLLQFMSLAYRQWIRHVEFRYFVTSFRSLMDSWAYTLMTEQVCSSLSIYPPAQIEHVKLFVQAQHPQITEQLQHKLSPLSKKYEFQQY